MKLENVQVIKQYAPVSGTAKNGNEWKKKVIIVLTQGEFQKKVAICLWNKMADLTFNDRLTYNFDIEVESRDFNDKWYTEAKAWKCEEVKSEPQGFKDRSVDNNPPPPTMKDEPEIIVGKDGFFNDLPTDMSAPF